MKILLKGKKIAVEKLKKQSKNQMAGIIIPDSEEYLGEIKFVGDDSTKGFKVGQKVYFSTAYQQCRMGGKDLCVMDDTEIFAIVEE